MMKLLHGEIPSRVDTVLSEVPSSKGTPTDQQTDMCNPTDAIASKNLLMLIPLLALFYVALHNILCEVKLK